MVRAKDMGMGIWKSIWASLAVTLVVALAGAGTALAQNTHYGTGACGSSGSCGSGTNDSAFGYDALYSNASYGSGNVAVGGDALEYNTDGAANAAVGYNTLLKNTTGGNNVAVGGDALYYNTEGYYNTALGFAALFESTGSNNTALGFDALWDTTGSNNIGIGYGGGASLSTGSYDIDIGNDGSIVPGESNTIRIGEGSNQTATYIAGINNTGSNAIAVYIDANGMLYGQTSSARYKRDINDIGDASSKLMKLRPVTFRYKNDQQRVKHYGLIAEEVERVYPEMVAYGTKGEAEGVRYDDLPAMLLNEMQKQVKQNQQLAAQVALMKPQIDALKKKDAQIDALTERLNAVERQVRVARPEHLASAMP